jgi:acyl carrier protein
MEQLENRIIKVISKQARVEETIVTPQTLFIGDLGMDSVDFIELVMYLEKDLHIKIPDDQVKQIRSVGDLIESIKPITLS